MGDHLGRKHELLNLARKNPDALREIIGQCAIRADDAKILYYFYAEKQDQNYVADIMGMSVQNVRKRFYAASECLWNLAKLRNLLK